MKHGRACAFRCVARTVGVITTPLLELGAVVFYSVWNLVVPTIHAFIEGLAQ